VTTSQKAALSLLISVLLFGGFTALAFTGLFDLIETRFYNPTITSSMTREITQNADSIDKYLTELQTRFSQTLNEPAIRRSFLPNQNADDIFERSRIYGLLVESIGGLQSIRFIDSGGSRLHYSSSSSDILQQSGQSVSYRNYNEPSFPYESIAVNDGQNPKYTLDEEADRILFSFPFFDSYEVYRGTALFSLSSQTITNYLISEGKLKVGEDICVVSDPPGFVYGLSAEIEKALLPQISGIWKEGGLKVANLNSEGSNISLTFISARTSHGFFVGRLVNEDLFTFPQIMKIILLVSFFLTVYLTIFLLLNIRQDSVTIVQNRLKQLQISLIEQYYERKGDVDWSRWSRELELRRDEIRGQLTRGIKTASGSKSGDIDTLIDKSWDELLAVIGGRKDSGIDEEKLQTILSRILSAIPGAAIPVQISTAQPAALPSASQLPAVRTSAAKKEAPSAQPAVSAAEEAEPVEELEEVEAVEELGAETPASTVEEAEPLEELEEIEEIAAVEEAEPVEELGEEAAPVFETQPVEQAAEAVAAVEEVEPLEELEEIEEIEAVEEAEPIEELGEEAEPVFETQPVEQAPEAEAVAAVEEVEPLEELEEIEEIEAVDEPVIELEEVVDASVNAAEVLPASVDEEAELIVELEEAETAPAGEAGVEAAVITEPAPLDEVPIIDASDFSAGLVDEAIGAMGAEEEIEELEELHDLEELDEAQEAEGEGEPAGAEPAAGSFIAQQISSPELDVANLASQIEFSPFPEPESTDDEALHDDFEIVSPFSTMLSDFADAASDDFLFSGEEVLRELPYEAPTPVPPSEQISTSVETGSDETESAKETEAEPDSENLEFLGSINEEESDEGENKDKKESPDEQENETAEEGKDIAVSLPLIFTPFNSITDSAEIETLEVLPDPEEERKNAEDDGVIEEREGVPYISGDVLHQGADSNTDLNPDFKNLVDSVIK